MMNDIEVILLVYLTRAVTSLEAKIDVLIEKGTAMSAEMDTLVQEVAATKAGEESARAALDGLAARIDALVAAGNTDPELAALAEDLRTSREALAAAVVADARP